MRKGSGLLRGLTKLGGGSAIGCAPGESTGGGFRGSAASACDDSTTARPISIESGHVEMACASPATVRAAQSTSRHTSKDLQCYTGPPEYPVAAAAAIARALRGARCAAPICSAAPSRHPQRCVSVACVALSRPDAGRIVAQGWAALRQAQLRPRNSHLNRSSPQRSSSQRLAALQRP